MEQGQLINMGDVGLLENLEADPVKLSGEERQACLRILYAQNDCRYSLCDLRPGRGYRLVSWSEVDWSGLRIKITRVTVRVTYHIDGGSDEEGATKINSNKVADGADPAEVLRLAAADIGRRFAEDLSAGWPECSICRGWHPNDDRHPCE